MNLILNIGLRVGLTDTLNTVGATVACLERAGFGIKALRVAQSATEPTVVAHVTLPAGLPVASWPSLFAVSCELGQDCIATWAPDVRQGALVGPRADTPEWGNGVFNPEYFLTLSGAPLAPSPLAGLTRDQSEDREQPYTLEQLAALGQRSPGDAVPAWIV
jgi:hypothetical protein